MSNVASVLPDLEIGVEIPWPLQREGKQVYAKLLDFGGFPLAGGTKGKLHEVPDIEWKQISWDHSYITKSSDGQKINLGLVSTPTTLGGGPMPWRFMVDRNSVQVNMLNTTDYREWDTIVICLLYTRTGEGEKSGSLIQPGPDGMVLTSRDDGLMWEKAHSCECKSWNYSLAEVNTGQKWIDGKDIYAKTILTGALLNIDNTYTATGIEGGYKVIDFKGLAYSQVGQYVHLPHAASRGDGSIAINVYGPDAPSMGNTVRITTGADYSRFTHSHVTVFYTKE